MAAGLGRGPLTGYPEPMIENTDVAPESATRVMCPDCGTDQVSDLGPCRLLHWNKALPEEEKRIQAASSASRLMVCRTCDLAFRYPFIDPMSLARLYAELPAERWEYEEGQNESWRLARSKLRSWYSERDQPRVLDVGAFDGVLLRSLPRGWKCSAIEPSDAAREKLAACGIPCVARFLDAPEPEYRGTFDVVMLFDVFEHLTHPLDALRHAMAYLKPAGKLVVSTGNHAHWTWRALRGDHWYCEPAQHIVFGSDHYFRHAAKKLNASIVSMESHAHLASGWKVKWKAALESWVFGVRKARSGSLWLAKVLMRMPGLGYLKHRTNAPYAPWLPDHLFVVLEKTA